MFKSAEREHESINRASETKTDWITVNFPLTRSSWLERILKFVFLIPIRKFYVNEPAWLRLFTPSSQCSN